MLAADAYLTKSKRTGEETMAFGAKTVHAVTIASGVLQPAMARPVDVLCGSHEAKRMVKNELIHYGSSWTWCGVLGQRMGHSEPELWDALPFGAIDAVCDLADCRPTGSFSNQELDEPRQCPELEPYADQYQWTERMLGNYALGRFGWVLDNIRALSEPIPCRGRQGLFQVSIPSYLCHLTSEHADGQVEILHGRGRRQRRPASPGRPSTDDVR